MLPVVCITGCSSGFGKVTALKCAPTCQVIATVRSEKQRHDLQSECLKLGISIDIQWCDVTDEPSVRSLMAYIKDTYKALHVLINNAGIALGGFFEDISPEQVELVMKTNVMGVMTVTREALPLLRHSAPAKIINMSSIAGCSASPTISIYNASKWALEGFSEALMFELKPFNVDVVLVQPGQYRTKIFSDNLRMGDGIKNTNSPYYKGTQKAMQALESRIKKQLKDPSAVALLCARLVHKKQPRFRYRVGWDAHLRYWVRYWLPFEVYRWILHRIIKPLFR